MCDRCADQYDRRAFLRRAAILGGAAVAGGILLPEAAGSMGPPFETIGLGEDRLPGPRALELPERHRRPMAKVRPSVRPPPIVTRAQWGADESIRTSERAFAPIRKLIVHHTASPSNPRDPVSWVRKTYEFHVLGRGYSDVGYNFLIDHHGVVYEGRWARDYPPGEVHDGENAEGLGVVGGHAFGMNTGSCGIVLIGDFTVGQPTKAMLSSLIRLLAWKCAAHRIDPLGWDLYVNFAGVAKTFPNICGHKDVGITICPGPHVFNRFPAIRQAVHARTGSFPAKTVDLATATRYNYSRSAWSTAAGSHRVVGYRVLTADSEVVSLGRLPTTRSPRDQGVTDVLAIAPSPGSRGYYSLDSRGGVLAFGTAKWYGSLRAGGHVFTPVDIAATRKGDGYWILTANGGVFGYGSARWHGSLSKYNGHVRPLKLRSTPSGQGYWILAANGKVYAYGDAVNAGSPGNKRSAVVDLAPTSSGKGYWVLRANGTIAALGDATVHGDLAKSARRHGGAVTITASPLGSGYYVATGDGRVTAFGHVPSYGGVRGRPLGLAAVAI